MDSVPLRPGASFWVRQRFSAALLVAALVHGVFLFRPKLSAPSPRGQDVVFVQLDLTSDEEVSPTLDEQRMPDAERHSVIPSVVPERKTGARAQSSGSQLVDAVESPGEETLSEVDNEGPSLDEPAAVSKNGVHLFLNSKNLAELVKRPTAQKNNASSPSIGLLSEGIAADEAGRSYVVRPAIRAGRLAARRAPTQGSAFFEIKTDETGAVSSILLTSASGDGSWEDVLRELRELLKDQKTALPKGAKGMVARLRIDRGRSVEDWAKNVMKRRAAVGEGHHEKDFARDESARPLDVPGRITPTLGLNSDMVHVAVKTQVNLISETFL